MIDYEKIDIDWRGKGKEIKDPNWFVICPKCGCVKWTERLIYSQERINEILPEGFMLYAHDVCGGCKTCHFPQEMTCFICSNRANWKRISASRETRKEIYNLSYEQRLRWLTELVSLMKLAGEVK